MSSYKGYLDGMYQPRPEPRPKPRSGKGTAFKVAAAFGVLALVGIAGVAIASGCGYSLRHQEIVSFAPVEAAQPQEQLSAVLRRENAEESIPGLQPYDYSVPVDTVVSGSVVSGGAAAHATGEDSSIADSYPITTPNTPYTSLMEPNTTQTSTTTLTTTVVIIPSQTYTCTSKPEETETVLVTVTVVPELSQSPTYGTPAGDATVTGDPATVTDVQTDVSYTSGAPDATVSGTPSTVTDVQTDTQFTSGAPDATVSGEPTTITSVITNTAGEPMTTLTFTSINTVYVTVATVTRTRSSSVDFDSSVLGLPHSTTSGNSSSSAAITTHTETVTVTGGTPVTKTTTIELPAYGGGYPTTYGTGLTINATTLPTYIPPVVSAGAEGRGHSMVCLVSVAMVAMWLF
ncbi:hypothetical protein CCM_02635 [Cordyceps militaris CM01]|uniref:Uncharacterized protein n=1 Tax=Cordyceps militaris (strain CM01) TaxID=983644 RepID=G3JAV1_CORMM|nr:uncharacterized protein CCM_02635 [Cordyceps militaris CM01]EGX94364.1 hypothetical protein CCM_02635 [Cordyceps militaris CM01]